MELDREQIVKALDCCRVDRCGKCPYYTGEVDCMRRMSAYALALVKELDAENEKLRAELASRPPKLIITKRR